MKWDIETLLGIFLTLIILGNTVYAWHSADSNINIHVTVYYDNYGQLVDMFEHREDVGVYI